MSHIPKSLHELFPADADLLRRLKSGNSHFQALAQRLEATEAEVDAIAAGVDPASDARADEAHKRRLRIFDEIAALLTSERTA